MATDFQRRKVAGVFGAMDADSNGYLEEADFEARTEHKQVVYAWKGSDDGIEEVFGKLDLNGDGQLSRKEFRELWSGFWRDDDQESPSQWIFGPY
ncbi:EF-hand domain-containing protein [Kribbella sp. NPDC058245]|uniref:EF-hand domain-containing protein n=1 Tax=Kribbella sp. NPDC058245 TaxID=3346399 RepID=UPI0036F0F4F9